MPKGVEAVSFSARADWLVWPGNKSDIASIDEWLDLFDGIVSARVIIEVKVFDSDGNMECNELLDSVSFVVNSGEDP